uniref:Alpha-1,3-mannosyl-glycoprotein 2-beta-N-acetylglucosaminyltransferase n=1 Tax=Plectus sambesii TaxID=2011161 RepID=A0A914WP62_9BILA
MRRRYLYVSLVLILFVCCHIILFGLVPDSATFPSNDVSALGERIDQLQRILDEQARNSARLKAFVDIELRKLRDLTTTTTTIASSPTSLTTSDVTTKSPAANANAQNQPPIAVLVFACNRPAAITYHVSKLLRYRPSAVQFPVVISQDCDSIPVADAVRAFGSNISYIKHESAQKAGIQVPSNHAQYASYYMIARHYKLALTHVFEKLNFSAAIITEDDLDIAEDFFEYFGATRPLLDSDRSLMCVSAWNDNGKAGLIDANATELLYRSDFFSGLGWMLTRRLWEELSPIWPAGFWDDWLRDPARRQNRACIRPEIPRTSMTNQGKVGASQGLFFSKHLIKIKLNERPFSFTQANLSYLLQDRYDADFINNVYASREVTLEQLQNQTTSADSKALEAVRLTYTSAKEFSGIAAKLQLMVDFKAGVPRTAYRGVVSCFVNNTRVFIAPPRSWTSYDPSWTGPPDIIEG